MGRPIRVVIAKPGLDGHDRGAKIVARSLRDAGMEVIYTGLHQTPEQVVATVVQEDADAVGLSILSGAHMTLVPRIMELLAAEGADDVLVIVGGTIPADDADDLRALGVAAVYTPGAPVDDMVSFLEGAVAAKCQSVAIAAGRCRCWCSTGRRPSTPSRPSSSTSSSGHSTTPRPTRAFVRWC